VGRSTVPWEWDNGSGMCSVLTDNQALTVLRGIVKGLCDERNEVYGEAFWEWSSYFVTGRPKKWQVKLGGSHCGGYATELEAIDALLTDLEASK
jgi:hypothetical protein